MTHDPNDFFTMTGRAVEDPDFMLEALRRNFLSEAHHFEGDTELVALLCRVSSKFQAARVHVMV